ncbi:MULTISPECIES: WXG100 family type VII secretion target [unclassified Mycobacterium]|uniref:WXG100 family type VII secretion target n=1 Tax=unclassified Mycobacterium TaxID=2642494 RepID=UPI002742133F|nr:MULTISPECIES: WXG100 family type VII secretion target [unclassified Mycobacterium]MDP7705845.1 WXG100 family type VII secretion target [Mycobacterium sp. TY815]MDP7725318.1 WXG100 family type VII secretion target [Mycobacterium sp. TY814]
MAPNLRAIPDALFRASIELADHGQILLDLQTSCHRDVDDAQRGWVGSSAVALSGLLDRWAAATAGQLARFGEHAGSLRVAAAGFSAMERHNAATLR